MSTRAQLRSSVRANLADAGITFYDDTMINDALQDAYDDVATRCRPIVKSASIAQQAGTPYYDLSNLGISDYLGTIAIFNPSSNLWLRDDATHRDLDRIRRDWETGWTGTPQMWCPHSLKYIIIVPNLAVVTTETLTVWYWALAPTMAESTTPLVATDMQNLLEHFATADLIETAEEFKKALFYWGLYNEDVNPYRYRCQNLAASDLLLRV